MFLSLKMPYSASCNNVCGKRLQQNLDFQICSVWCLDQAQMLVYHPIHNS